MRLLKITLVIATLYAPSSAKKLCLKNLHIRQVIYPPYVFVLQHL